MKIVVKDREEAFKVAGEMFPMDYDLDKVASTNAGYDVYRHSVIEQDAWISDLGSRLEVNVNGKTTNIWVEGEKPAQETLAAPVNAVIGYTVVTLKSTKNSDGKKLVWKNVEIDTDRSFKTLQERHYKRYGINYESYYVIDANGETVYSHAGIEE